MVADCIHVCLGAPIFWEYKLQENITLSIFNLITSINQLDWFIYYLMRDSNKCAYLKYISIYWWIKNLNLLSLKQNEKKEVRTNTRRIEIEVDL